VSTSGVPARVQDAVSSHGLRRWVFSSGFDKAMQDVEAAIDDKKSPSYSETL